MQININGNDCELNFGVQFVRELDKVAGMELSIKGQNQNFGMGLIKALPALNGFDPAVLSDVVYCACWPNKKRPSRKDVDMFIDDPNTDLEQVFKDVLAEMNNANGVKLATKNLQA